MTSRSKRRRADGHGRTLRRSLLLATALVVVAQPMASQTPPANPPIVISPQGQVSIGGTGLVVSPEGRVSIGHSIPGLVNIEAAPRTDGYSPQGGGAFVPTAHPSAVQALYVTADAAPGRPPENGRPFIEFRHSNGSQGIGFGYNTIYATGGNANQPLILEPKGTSSVEVHGPLTVTGTTTFKDGGVVPFGAIMMWSGNPNSVPAGWALCNGQTVNGRTTPNLSGRFVVGYSGTGSNQTVGTTGGVVSYPLAFTSKANVAGANSYDNFAVFDFDPSTRVLPILPPYYVIAFIMFVGT